jgi:hypothetical protein
MFQSRSRQADKIAGLRKSLELRLSKVVHRLSGVCKVSMPWIGDIWVGDCRECGRVRLKPLQNRHFVCYVSSLRTCKVRHRGEVFQVLESQLESRQGKCGNPTVIVLLRDRCLHLIHRPPAMSQDPWELGGGAGAGFLIPLNSALVIPNHL